MKKPSPPAPSGGGGGTKVISVNGKKNADFRAATGAGAPPPRILARVQQLRLLSKLEQAGLLSAAERAGVSLSALEASGALSTAESLGLLSRAADRGTPGLLYGLATALLVAGPAAVSHPGHVGRADRAAGGRRGHGRRRWVGRLGRGLPAGRPPKVKGGRVSGNRNCVCMVKVALFVLLAFVFVCAGGGSGV